MKQQMIILPLMALLLGACGGSNSTPSDQIVGAYTVESTFEVPDINSPNGKILGTGKVRDTIYIAAKQNGFEITNKKWRSNSYDMDGWKNLRPGANDGALYPFQATYDPTDNSLNSDPPGMMPTLYLDIDARKLYKDKERKKAYVKI
jgi:hypothetical protein